MQHYTGLAACSHLITIQNCHLHCLHLPAGYFNVAPPGQAPAIVATGNNYSSTPSGEPAIILRTDMGFTVTSPSDFDPSAQLQFSNALRQVTSQDNFMSISIIAFQVRALCVHADKSL